MASSATKNYRLVTLMVLCFWVGVSSCKSYVDDLSLSLNEKQLMDEFKARVLKNLPYEYMKEELYLIKWLRSYGFQVDVAETRLMNNLKWREELKLDSGRREDFSDWREQFPYYLEGRDRAGRPLLYFDLGSWAIRRIVLEGKSGRFIRYLNVMMDETCTLVRNLGHTYKNITRGQLIVNSEDYFPDEQGCHGCHTIISALILSYMDHFPECLDKLIFVNTNPDILFLAIRPLLGSEARDSVKVYFRNKGFWRAELRKDFEANQLPPVLGGTRIYKGMEDDYSE